MKNKAWKTITELSRCRMASLGSGERTAWEVAVRESALTWSMIGVRDGRLGFVYRNSAEQGGARLV